MSDHHRQNIAKYCPLNGNPCVGVESCKPAMDFQGDESEKGEGEFILTCPISDVVLALQSISYAAIRLTQTLPDLHVEEEPGGELSLLERVLARADQA